jgi:hypothetical protein
MVFDQRGHDEQERSKRQFLSACLRGILQESENSRTLVLVKEKNYATELCSVFSQDGFPCSAIHGQISQAQRQCRAQDIQDGTLKLLVATEGLANSLVGLKPSVTHLISFDWCEIQDYAARLKLVGQGGTSLMLFQYDDNFPFLADTYVRFLEAAAQAIPPELKGVANEVATGRRQISPAFFKKKKNKQWDAWATAAARKPCWYMENTGVCGKGESCPYSHACGPHAVNAATQFAALQGLGLLSPALPQSMLMGLQSAAASSSASAPATSAPGAATSPLSGSPFLTW